LAPARRRAPDTISSPRGSPRCCSQSAYTAYAAVFDGLGDDAGLERRGRRVGGRRAGHHRGLSTSWNPARSFEYQLVVLRSAAPAVANDRVVRPLS
jgi:hypothetical protein